MSAPSAKKRASSVPYSRAVCNSKPSPHGLSGLGSDTSRSTCSVGWVVSSILALPVEPAPLLCETAAPAPPTLIGPALRRVRRVKKRACRLAGGSGRRPPSGTASREAFFLLRVPERCPGRATG
eukprot:scaffold24559_cov63-Phaeocystis_antarctica.AAC.3